jgi:hypothetical protein
VSDELELLPEDPPPRRDDLPAHPLYGGGPLDSPEALDPGERCANHPKAKAHGACSSCQTPICGNCRILSGGKVLCLGCRGSQAWRPPRSLSLAIAVGWLTLALSGVYRFVVEWSPAPDAPLLPDGLLGLPASMTSVTTWGVVAEHATTWVSYGQLVAVGVTLVALAHSRSTQAQTARLAWRIGLACLLAGAAIVLAADTAYTMLVRSIF